jgi:hypothetical protein
VLPQVSGEVIKIGRKKIIVTTWIERLAPDVLRVMVQAYRPYFLGIGMISAYGFHMTTSGQIRAVTEAETWDFT